MFSSCLMSAFTICGTAFPFVSFITRPVRNSSGGISPLLSVLQSSAFSEITFFTYGRSSLSVPISEILRVFISFSGFVPVSKVARKSVFAVALCISPQSSFFMMNAKFSGFILDWETRMPFLFKSRVSSDAIQCAALRGFAPSATVFSKKSALSL